MVAVHLQVFWKAVFMSQVQGESMLGCCGYLEGGMVSDWELREVNLWASMRFSARLVLYT